MSPIEVNVERLRDQSAAATIWRDLEPRADGSFFTSWTWIGTWLAATALEPVMVTAYAGTTVVAAGLFGASPGGRLLLHETGDPAWDRLTIEYNDLLVARDVAGDPRSACLAALAARAGTREIALSGVDAQWFRAAAAGGLPTRIAARRPTFAIRLAAPAAGEPALIDGLGPNTRAALRQTLRRLGPLAGRPAATLDEAHAHLDALIALHQASWQTRGEPGAFAEPRVRAFHHRLVDAGWADGAVELFAVSGAAAPVAYLLNFCHRDVVHAYQAGIVGGLPNRLKPGLAAHVMCAEHHAERHRACYDLMAGEARYKRNLGAPAGELVWMTAYANRTRAVVADLKRLKRGIARRLRGPA
jgi:CelD/BcsL family acetyltransferase involved in cellulose biosynthesis